MTEFGPAGDVTSAIAGALRAIAPPAVRTGVRRIGSDTQASLLGVERDAVSRAVQSRVREFAGGRALLRELIGRQVTIPVGADRRPELPDGIVASLAHDRRLAVAAVADRREAASLGIDVEPVAELESGIADHVLRPDDGTRDPLLALVLKEAAYKAWSSLGGRLLDHHDVRVDVDRSDYIATVVDDDRTLRGRFALAGDSWIALVVVGSPLIRDDRGSA